MTNAPMPRPECGPPFDEGSERLGTPAVTGTDDDGLRSYLRGMHPRQMLAMGEGMPVVIKQLVQLLFLLCWPFWAVAGLVVGVIYYWVLYPVLWVLFWPLRALIGDKKTAPEPADDTVIT